MSSFYRTYSSPSFERANSNSYKRREPLTSMDNKWTTQEKHYTYNRESEDDEYFFSDLNDVFYIIGDRVYVDGSRSASVAYFGEVAFAAGDWVGVVLDEPTGSHDGKFHGRKYFQCAPRHGLFVRPNRVNRLPDSALGSSVTSSRRNTPVQASNPLQRSNNSSANTFYYDEDYRVDSAPTASSLARKLKLIADHDNSDVKGAHRVGILKRKPRSSSLGRSYNLETENNQSSKTDELSTRAKQLESESVFNFRPRRAQLEEHAHCRNSSRMSANTPDGTKVDFSSKQPEVGDRVLVRSDGGKHRGTLRFLGETEFATGEWAGVELDSPEGKNDGSVLGIRYFHSIPKYGLFVPATRIKSLGSNIEGLRNPYRASNFESLRSSLKSPPPPSWSNRNSKYSTLDTDYKTRSTTPSYSYSSSVTPASDSSPTSPSLYPGSRYTDDILRLPTRYTHSHLGGTGHKSESWRAYADVDSRPKFDDNDIEAELKKDLRRHPAPAIRSSKVTSFSQSPPQARSVRYTFTSSKYDGNPIVRRVVEYS